MALRQSTWLDVLLEVVVRNLPATFFAVAGGTTLGVILVKSELTSTSVLRNLFLPTWSGKDILKFFLASTASGAALIAAEVATGIVRTLHIKPIASVSDFVGGCLLGAAAHFLGYLPSTVLTQIGLGKEVEGFHWIVLGSLSGAVAHSMTASALELTILGKRTTAITLDGLSGRSFVATAIPLVLVSMTGALILERLAPSPLPTSLPVRKTEGLARFWTFLERSQWTPLSAGILYGLAPLSLSLLLAKAAPSPASGFAILVADPRRWAFNGWYKVCAAASIPLGARAGVLWSHASAVRRASERGGVASRPLTPAISEDDDEPLKNVLPLQPTWRRKVAAFAGGFLMLFGARMGDGDLLGGAVPALSQLSTAGFVASFGFMAGGCLMRLVAPNLILENIR